MNKFLALTLIIITMPAFAINLEKFKEPFCMIGNGKAGNSHHYKVKYIKKYQRKISRKSKDFRKNRSKENKAVLHGSPKWVTYKFLAARGYTRDEIQFAFFAMTLFGEARNLDEQSMTMVAKVINNRKKSKNYADTVTDLAQFSTWYYKNQRDNAVLLCPSKAHRNNWKKAVKIAAENFNKNDETLGSTHYFSPYNMVPRFRVPNWARGKHAVSYGGHIFIINKSKYKGAKKPVYISKKKRNIKARRGKIIL